MDMSLIWLLVAAFAMLLGLHGGYFGALADACNTIGKGLGGASEKTNGFQDAITPPSSTNARLINWIATIALFVMSWFYLGPSGLGAAVILRVLAAIVVGAVMKSEPPKKHFCTAIYRSMANREADFVKSGDQMRADAMGQLRAKFESSSFADQLTS